MPPPDTPPPLLPPRGNSPLGHGLWVTCAGPPMGRAAAGRWGGSRAWRCWRAVEADGEGAQRGVAPLRRIPTLAYIQHAQ